LPALDVFKLDQPAQSLVPLTESTISPAELLFGGALTGMIFRWKLTLSIDMHRAMLAKLDRDGRTARRAGLHDRLLVADNVDGQRQLSGTSSIWMTASGLRAWRIGWQGPTQTGPSQV